jgi:hypothetical protein
MLGGIKAPRAAGLPETALHAMLAVLDRRI